MNYLGFQQACWKNIKKTWIATLVMLAFVPVFPVVWCHPWRVEITSALKPGENQLEIEVVNLWPNRLIGDRGLPVPQRRTRTNLTIDAKQAILPSGLLGPVRVLSCLKEDVK